MGMSLTRPLDYRFAHQNRSHRGHRAHPASTSAVLSALSDARSDGIKEEKERQKKQKSIQRRRLASLQLHKRQQSLQVCPVQFGLWLWPSHREEKEQHSWNEAIFENVLGSFAQSKGHSSHQTIVCLGERQATEWWPQQRRQARPAD